MMGTIVKRMFGEPISIAFRSREDIALISSVLMGVVSSSVTPPLLFEFAQDENDVNHLNVMLFKLTRSEPS